MKRNMQILNDCYTKIVINGITSVSDNIEHYPRASPSIYPSIKYHLKHIPTIFQRIDRSHRILSKMKALVALEPSCVYVCNSSSQRMPALFSLVKIEKASPL